MEGSFVESCKSVGIPRPVWVMIEKAEGIVIWCVRGVERRRCW